MKITVKPKMINIDSDNIVYSNIRNLYTIGNGHCEEIENWFDKTELWNKVFNGQASLEEHDVYVELVINKY